MSHAWVVIVRRGNQIPSDRLREQEAILSDEVPTLDVLLSNRPKGRVLELNGIGAEFALILQAFLAEGKKVPEAEDFKRVGRASGTHLLKLITQRAPAENSVVRNAPNGSNQHSGLLPSINPNEGRRYQAGKLVFRPWEVAGHSTRSLADHILNPDDLSPTLTKGFADAFGEEALAVLRESLTTPLPPVSTLPVAEFPIIFLPRPGGGDLQVTPLAPAEAYVRMREVTEPYFRKWHRQYVTDKPQNISSAVGKQRTRFLAEMPPVLSSLSAELYRYAHGGRFPRWRDKAVPDAIAAYSRQFDIDHSNQDIRAGRDRRADALIATAREFIDDTLADTRFAHPECSPAAPPSVTTILLDRYWPPGGFDQARRVLTSDHFKGRLKAAGEA